VPNCTQAIALANGNGATFSCVGGVTANDCLQKVAASEADVTKVGGECCKQLLHPALSCQCPRRGSPGLLIICTQLQLQPLSACPCRSFLLLV
jgi:hypothetical protein